MFPDLSRLLRPKSIAAIGGAWAANVVEQCQRMKFSGAVWPVHPSRDEVHGIPCHRSVADLPGAVDAAFVGVNRELTIDIVAALSRSGSGGAVCFASGFLESETAGSSGAELQRLLVEAAGRMPILGPNCYGLINYLDGALLWPDQHGGERVERGVAIITQSSNIAINMTMQRRGLPIAYVVTAGNQAQLGLADIASALIDDPRVTALGLHIEGIGDVRRFESMANKSRAASMPVIALKTGRSEMSRAAALSHTASLSGESVASDALLARLGIVQVASVTAFLEALKLLHVHGPLTGNALCAMSCSGGEAALVADLAVGRGIAFRELTSNEIAEVEKVATPSSAVANPLDYSVQIWNRTQEMTATFSAMMACGFDLSMLVLDHPRDDRCDPASWRAPVEALAAASAQTGGPAALVSLMPENMPESLARDLVGKGIAPLCGMEDALAAAEAAVNVGQALKEPGHPPVLLVAGPVGGPSRLLSEFDAKTALAAHGLNIPRMALGSSPSAVVREAAGLAFPLALKATGMPHKSDAGAVRLGIGDMAELAAAAEALAPLTQWFLVEEMATGAVAELLIGVLADPAHGFVMTVGAGGVLAELLTDTAHFMLPARDDDIESALRSLRIATVISGYRSRPAGCLPAVIDAIQAVARYAEAEAERLEEVEVNPLLVFPDRVVAVDALIRLREAER